MSVRHSHIQAGQHADAPKNAPPIIDSSAYNTLDNPGPEPMPVRIVPGGQALGHSPVYSVVSGSSPSSTLTGYCREEHEKPG